VGAGLAGALLVHGRGTRCARCPPWRSLHAMTVSQQGTMRDFKLPTRRHFTYFIETLLRFRYSCFIGPLEGHAS
jgi:hypothetical protein